MDWQKVSAELAKKLDPKHVKGRKQGGGTVQYIEGWHAIAEMNAIFGFGAWDRETVELRQLGEPREVDGKIRVDYMARVRITVWGGADGRTVRDGCGFGQGIPLGQCRGQRAAEGIAGPGGVHHLRDGRGRHHLWLGKEVGSEPRDCHESKRKLTLPYRPLRRTR